MYQHGPVYENGDNGSHENDVKFEKPRSNSEAVLLTLHRPEMNQIRDRDADASRLAEKKYGKVDGMRKFMLQQQGQTLTYEDRQQSEKIEEFNLVQTRID